jgi:hypothetical protein
MHDALRFYENFVWGSNLCIDWQSATCIAFHEVASLQHHFKVYTFSSTMRESFFRGRKVKQQKQKSIYRADIVN